MDQEQLKQKLKEELNKINEQQLEFFRNNDTINDTNQKEIDKLRDEYDKVLDYLYVLDSQFISGNENVDLYKKDEEDANNLFGEYRIYLHNTHTSVGFVKYSGDEFQGSIGYIINERYRGHNYAYQAALLLLNFLRERKVSEVVILADSRNIASVRIMDKLKNDGFECEIIENSQCKTISYHYKLNPTIRKGKK